MARLITPSDKGYNLRQLLTQPFTILSAVLAIVLAVALVLVEKGELHLLLCDHHTVWADYLMPFLSDFTHWLPYVSIAALAIWRWREGLSLALALGLTTGIVQALKHIVQAPRPLIWFAENMPEVSLPLTDGVKMHHYLSFPSGHTATFFCFFGFLAIALFSLPPYPIHNGNYETPTKKEIHHCLRWQGWVQVLLFLLAALCSYSRIYLSQHFAADVLGGMIIGMLSVLLVQAIRQRIGSGSGSGSH